MTEEITIETRDDWNEGDFDKTSADRDDHSGNLGIGYISGESVPITTTQPVDDMVLQLRMDGISNAEVIDYSGNDRDFDVNGNPSEATGVFSTGAIQFNGYDTEEDYLELPDSEGLDPEGDLTVSVWAYKDVDDTQSMVSKHETNESPDGWDLSYGTNGDIIWRINRDGTDEIDLRSDSLPTGEWFHIVGVFKEDEEMLLYVDGEEVASEDASGVSINDNDEKIRVGARSESSSTDIRRWFEGRISEIIVWDKSLTSSEVETLYFDGQADNNFEGEWTSEVFEPEDGEDVEVIELEITADIDSDTSSTVYIEALDDEDNVIDSDTIEVDSGTDTYSVDLDEAPKFKIISEHEVSL